MSASNSFGNSRIKHWKDITIDATQAVNTVIDLLIPEDAKTIVMPEVVMLYHERDAATYQTSPVITIQDDSGNALASTYTVGTTAAQGKYAPVRPTSGTNVVAITGGSKLQAKITTAGVGVATSTRARTSNVATIVTGSAHGLLVGDQVRVNGMTDTTFNGLHTVLSVPTTTSFTFASNGADVVSGSDTGGDVGVKLLKAHVIALYW